MPKKSGTYTLPRQKKPRGAAIFKRPLRGIIPQKEQLPPWLTPPAEWPGSGAEWAVYWALQGLREEFQYQVPLLGGRVEAGGTVVDFFLPQYLLIIRVQGVHWHYEINSARARDDILKLALESKGFEVIDIDEDDALRDPIYYTKEALRGQDHSKRAGVD